MRSRNISQISIEAEGGLSFISEVQVSQPRPRLFIRGNKMETEFKPIKLVKYGDDWLPLSLPTGDLGLALSIAMAPIINGDEVIACGVMDLSPMSDRRQVLCLRSDGPRLEISRW